MRLWLLSTVLAAGGASVGGAGEFHPPVRLNADGVPVRVDSPGYAAPCWTDIDGDGKKDLLVGQFNGGQIRVYKNLGDGKPAEGGVKLAAGAWLKADGAVAEIPGVW